MLRASRVIQSKTCTHSKNFCTHHQQHTSPYTLFSPPLTRPHSPCLKPPFFSLYHYTILTLVIILYHTRTPTSYVSTTHNKFRSQPDFSPEFFFEAPTHTHTHTHTHSEHTHAHTHTHTQHTHTPSQPYALTPRQNINRCSGCFERCDCCCCARDVCCCVRVYPSWSGDGDDDD